MGAEKNLLRAIGAFCLCFWALAACAQPMTWDEVMAAGQTARQRGDYSEAEKQFSSALREAEGFGSTDPRLPATLNSLAGVLRISGKDVAAERLYQRALELQENILGISHLEVATTAYNLAVLYYDEAKYAQAEPFISAQWRFGRILWAQNT